MKDDGTTRLRDDKTWRPRSPWSVVSLRLGAAYASESGQLSTRHRTGAFTLKQRGRSCGFTLAEMLIAIAVLTAIVLFVTRLVDSAATIATQGNKHMDTESYVRPLFDRMAVDIAQMLKRNDVSYYLKSGDPTAPMGTGSTGVNDRLAFFTAASGYYNDNQLGYNSGYSVVAYRVNTDSASASYNRVERMGKGLPLNAAYANPTPTATNSVIPLLFLDNTSPGSYTTTIDSKWPAATRASPDPNYYPSDSYQKYETVGPQVFRLEYYYLTRGTNPQLVAYPSGSQLSSPTLNWGNANTINIKDIAAIVVAVAAIDPQSRKLLSDAQIATVVTKFTNYTFVGTFGAPAPGWLLTQWQNSLQTDVEIAAMPRPAIQGIRFYERYFYLNQ